MTIVMKSCVDVLV